MRKQRKVPFWDGATLKCQKGCEEEIFICCNIFFVEVVHLSALKIHSSFVNCNVVSLFSLLSLSLSCTHISCQSFIATTSEKGIVLEDWSPFPLTVLWYSFINLMRVYDFCFLQKFHFVLVHSGERVSSGVVCKKGAG